MKNRPVISRGNWLRFGDSGKAAVVCQIHADRADVEVVCFSDRDRAINDDVLWDGSKWQFGHPGPCISYADKYSRLVSFVIIQRFGRTTRNVRIGYD